MTKTEIKPKYILCDLDGCLLNTAWIWKMLENRPLSYEQKLDVFNRLANADATGVEIPCYKYLCFKASGGFKVHFITARSELIEVETINFIQRRFGLIYGKEFSASFRPTTDLLSPAESKGVRVQSMLDAGKEIAFAIDDEPEVLEMYRSKGIPAIEWRIGFIPVQVAAEFGNQMSNLLNLREEVSLN